MGLFSSLRPGTSLAAVLALLKTFTPPRLLLAFAAAGFASSWAIGMAVVAVFHGANVAVGGSTFTAVLDVAFGAAALGFAAGLERGWVQPARAKVETVGNRRVVAASPAPARPLRPGRRRRWDRHAFTRARLPGGAQRDRLRTAGSRARCPAGRDLRRPLVLGPLGTLALVVVRPDAALAYLDGATAYVRGHEHAILVCGSLVIGGYLVVKGTASLLA